MRHLRAFPLSLLTLCLLIGQSQPARAAKKPESKAVKKEEKANPSVITKVTPVAEIARQSAIWHQWTDLEGRKVDAMFCAFSKDFITIQTKDGKTFHFNVNILIPEDREFAVACAGKDKEASFSPAVIAAAAADVDRLIQAVLASKEQKPNPLATDEQFLRRIYVDAIGRVPTAEEANEFLNDASGNKRAKLIDKLVYSPGYTMQMFNWMADLLRVKDTFGKGIPAFTFEDWLKSRIASNAPWNQLVKEMVTADGRLTDNGAGGFMLFDADMPLDGVSNLMTTFLGTNMACAQCHDHPLAEWKQRDFFQMASFFGATDGKNEAIQRQIQGTLKADPTLSKQAVIKIALVNSYRLEDQSKNTLTFPTDYKYKDAKPSSPVSPVLISWDKGDAKLPIYKLDTTHPSQLRDEFARWLTSPQNPRFATNIANRLWKKAFGLAVLEPVVDIDDLSQASSPELLAHLTSVMKAARFDLREFQRVIYNSRTYQSGASVTPDLAKGPYLFNGPLVRRLTAEQAWDSFVVNSVGTNADNILLRRSDALMAYSLPDGKVTAAVVHKVIDNINKNGKGKSLTDGKKTGGGSTMGLATGYEGEKPITRFSMTMARASELPQPASESHFLRLFGQGDRLLTDSATNDGSVPQVLQMMNGSIGKLVSDPTGVAIGTALKSKATDGSIHSLYLSYLSRHPTSVELAAAQKGLANGLHLADLAWVLANTREFLFIQ